MHKLIGGPRAQFRTCKAHYLARSVGRPKRRYTGTIFVNTFGTSYIIIIIILLLRDILIWPTFTCLAIATYSSEMFDAFSLLGGEAFACRLLCLFTAMF